MLVLLTQAKRETQQTPSNTHGLGQLAYCKIEVTEPQAGKVDPSTCLVICVHMLRNMYNQWLQPFACVCVCVCANTMAFLF